jgi:hypothetical protein
MYQTLIFIGIALVFALLKVYLEKRLAPLDAVGVERQLGDLAFSRGCSVFQLFTEAGSVWNFSQAKIESDFKQYVNRNDVPPYLQDYLQKQVQAGDHTYQKLLYPGGRPPYL